MTDTPEEQSWAFALRVYAEPGVAEACLHLQEQAGVDVMLLLTVGFACRRGILLSPSDISDMDANCRLWREQIVQPLRALRVALKSGPAPAPNAGTERLRSQIKASELLAERLESDRLLSWLQQIAGAPCATGIDEMRTALTNVVSLVLPELHSDRMHDVAPAIDTIAAAAARSAVSPL